MLSKIFSLICSQIKLSIFGLGVTQGVVSEYSSGSTIFPTGRKIIEMEDKIHKLNIDKTPLLMLLNKIGKESVTQMKYEWMEKERKADWVTITGIGGAWDSSADSSGTIDVGSSDIGLFAEGDVVQIPTVSQTVNIYVDSVNTTLNRLTCYTVDSTIDLSSVGSGTVDMLLLGNSFEVGSGKGTIKTQQPSELYNYVEIVQTPVGITTTADNIRYRGGDEWNEQMWECGVDHAFKLEKLAFFGQRKQLTQGRMNSNHAQYFAGGVRSFLSTNVTNAAGNLTESAWVDWLNDVTRYSENPAVFAGETVFEGLHQWADGKIRMTQSEKTLGINITKYTTPYGKTVMVIPHRELLCDDYAGVAFSIDLKAIKQVYLKGKRSLDTHIAMNVQDNDLKQRIDEYRTWFGLKLHQEKRHGLLYGVTGISTS